MSNVTESKSEAEAPGSEEQFCPECGSVIRRRAEICPDCGVRVEDASEPEGKSRISQTGYLAIGGICGLISVIFLPIIFAPVGFIAGIQLFRVYSEAQGALIMVWNLIAGFIGFVLGFLSLFLA